MNWLPRNSLATSVDAWRKIPDVGKSRLSRVSNVIVGRSEMTRPELKRFASGRAWKIETNPGAAPKNVFVGCVSTESYSVVVGEAQAEPGVDGGA